MLSHGGVVSDKERKPEKLQVVFDDQIDSGILRPFIHFADMRPHAGTEKDRFLDLGYGIGPGDDTSGKIDAVFTIEHKTVFDLFDIEIPLIPVHQREPLAILPLGDRQIQQ